MLRAAVESCWPRHYTAPAIEDMAAADFRAVIKALAPNCAPAVTPENAPLLVLEPLLEAVLNDNAETLLRGLLDLIRAQKHTKKFDIYAMVRALSTDKPLLRDIEASGFCVVTATSTLPSGANSMSRHWMP